MRSYSRGELQSTREEQGIDGVLMDHRAKGIDVRLAGTDEIEGHPAYRLDVALPNGSKRHVRIDSTTFLEVKSGRDSTTRGRRAVDVYYRNYRRIDGLMFPTTIETTLVGGATIEIMTTDDVTLKLTLSDARFARPTDLDPPGPSRHLKSS